MKKKVKKPLSRLDKQGLEVAAQSKAIVDTGHRITRLECRVDKVDSSLARELFAIREAFQLTDEWRNRALKAEYELASLPKDRGAVSEVDVRYWQDRFDKAQAAEDIANKLVNDWAKRAVAAEGSLKYAQDTLDQFKREDEARAETIREIVRPLGFEYFAPMDAVREMAKLTFSLRDDNHSLREQLILGNPGFHGEDCPAKPPRLGMCNCGLWGGKSNLDKQPDAQEEKPEPDCYCVKWYGKGYFLTLNFDSYMIKVLPDNWEVKRAVCLKGCETCGGTGYRRKDSPSPPDATPTKNLLNMEYCPRCGDSMERGNNGVWECLNTQCIMTTPRKRIHTSGRDSTYIKVCGDPACWCQKQKPLRLLVEIVANKDEKHGTKVQEFGRVMLICETAPSRINPHDMECRPAMSTVILPEMPTIRQLWGIYVDEFNSIPQTQRVRGDAATEAGTVRGIKAVLAACGLEVAE